MVQLKFDAAVKDIVQRFHSKFFTTRSSFNSLGKDLNATLDTDEFSGKKERMVCIALY